MNEKDVVSIRLTSSEHLVARFVEETETEVMVEFPMVIENKTVEGVPVINLSKYLPFDPQQYATISKAHIITMGPLYASFERYYYNVIKYQAMVSDPLTMANLAYLNQRLEEATDISKLEFLAALENNKDKVPSVLSDTIN